MASSAVNVGLGVGIAVLILVILVLLCIWRRKRIRGRFKRMKKLSSRFFRRKEQRRYEAQISVESNNQVKEKPNTASSDCNPKDNISSSRNSYNTENYEESMTSYSNAFGGQHPTLKNQQSLMSYISIHEFLPQIDLQLDKPEISDKPKDAKDDPDQHNLPQFKSKSLSENILNAMKEKYRHMKVQQETRSHSTMNTNTKLYKKNNMVQKNSEELSVHNLSTHSIVSVQGSNCSDDPYDNFNEIVWENDHLGSPRLELSSHKSLHTENDNSLNGDKSDTILKNHTFNQDSQIVVEETEAKIIKQVKWKDHGSCIDECSLEEQVEMDQHIYQNENKYIQSGSNTSSKQMSKGPVTKRTTGKNKDQVELKISEESGYGSDG